MTDTKTLKTFVEHLEAKGFVTDGKGDYQKVDVEATEYFGGRISNELIWKVINHLGKPKPIAVVDDL